MTDQVKEASTNNTAATQNISPVAPLAPDSRKDLPSFSSVCTSRGLYGASAPKPLSNG